MTDRRACQSLTKRGTACKAHPMHGSDHCSAHNPDLPDSARFGSSVQAHAAGNLGGRPRRPREIELIQEVAEEFRVQLRAVYSEGLTAEVGVVVGDGEDARVEFIPDHKQRLATAKEIQDRLHGRPRQTMDVNSESRHLAVNVTLNDPEFVDALGTILRRRPASDAVSS